jgi:hypothetical protein
MNPHPADDDPGLPGHVAAAARQAAEDLYQALRPAMATARPSPQVSALWQIVKMLNAVSGGLDLGSVPEAGRPRARWEETAYLASNIADKALTITADGMTPQQAAGYLLNNTSDVQDTAAASGGVIELTPPDYPDTSRTLSVTIGGDTLRTLSVTADRGPAPQPRPHTAATLLRLAHHLHRVGAVLSDLVLEPEADGIPICGRSDKQITCEICQRTVGADIARTIEIAKPWLRTVKVCSVTCARAAHAGEHSG